MGEAGHHQFLFQTQMLARHRWSECHDPENAIGNPALAFDGLDRFFRE